MAEYKLEPRVKRVLNSIGLEIIPGFEWFIESPQLGEYGFVHCKSKDHIFFKYLSLVLDLNSRSDEQIINHAHAILGIERKERTVKMISSEQKKEAREAGSEKARIWLPALNPDLDQQHLFNIGMDFARMSGYSDVDACMAYVAGFTSGPKKTKLIESGTPKDYSMDS